MTTTVGPIGSAPAPSVATLGDYRVDPDTDLLYRNVDGRTWRSQGAAPDSLIAALLTSTATETHLARGVVVIAADQTSPPAGTPAGTVIVKRTT